MAYRTQGSQATAEATLDLLAFDDEFDPLAVDDSVIDQEWMDDENPYDTIDYPTMRDLPPSVHHAPVYSPERQGSVTAALRALVERNPNRRPVLFNIVGLCEGGCASSVISEKVDEWQRENRSVYAPMTLCRMLERAGALKLDMPETTEEQEVVEEGTTYLEIKETVDPVWYATDEALALRAEYLAGKAFRAMVLEGNEYTYAKVYLTLMGTLCSHPLTLAEVETLTDTFDITKSPRRFGQHFIDVLERADCVAWAQDRWNITDLGKTMFAELKACTEGANSDN